MLFSQLDQASIPGAIHAPEASPCILSPLSAAKLALTRAVFGSTADTANQHHDITSGFYLMNLVAW